MKKGIAIICLFSFLSLQYGKLATYWQCRLVAAITTTHCDCEKYLPDVHDKNLSSSPVTTVKEKTDECYVLTIFANDDLIKDPIRHTPFSNYHSLIREDHSKNIFQPPRV